jgi:protease I
MTALILVADGFEDLQLFTPMYRLLEEGIAVKIATPDGQKAAGIHGYRVLPDMPIGEVNPAEYELLLIPGGHSPERLRLREQAVDIARTFMDLERPVAAVGHGAQLLLSAGSLVGRQATSSPGIRDDLRHADARYLDEGVVRDGNLLTCRGCDDLPDFCHQLVTFLRVGV